MDNLVLEKTDKTPYVAIDCEQGTITIEGICIPEDPYAFFEPIKKKIDCIKQTKGEILFDIYLDYFNTGASKGLLDLFVYVASLEKENISSKVIWKVDEDDEESKESGEVLQEISKLPFEYISV